MFSVKPATMPWQKIQAGVRRVPWASSVHSRIRGPDKQLRGCTDTPSYTHLAYPSPFLVNFLSPLYTVCSPALVYCLSLSFILSALCFTPSAGLRYKQALEEFTVRPNVLQFQLLLR